MDLSQLLQIYREHDNAKRIADALKEPSVKLHLAGIVGTADAFIAAATYQNHDRSHHLFIFSDKEKSAYFQNDLQNLLEKKTIELFPDSFKKPGQFSEQNGTNIQLRTETLNRLVNSVTGNELVVTYPEAIFEKVVTSSALKQSTILIRIDDKLDFDSITETLMGYGFQLTDFVYEPGQFAVRGGILDIFLSVMNCLIGLSCLAMMWSLYGCLTRCHNYRKRKFHRLLLCRIFKRSLTVRKRLIC